MSAQAHRVRFAPSPTGSLHLGNARTALFNWLVARRTGGAFVLRIEDTDTVREEEGSEASILEDLRWLGLDWDEGPDRGGPFAPYRQSERSERYASAADRLLGDGSAYRCFCTEEELEAERDAMRRAGAAPRYSGRCRGLPAEESDGRAARGEACAIRFRTAPSSTRIADLTVSFEDRLRGRVEFPLAELGDPVLVRRDGRPTYNFAVVVDDAAMDVTLVLRGDDHLSNTPRQVLLYRALGRPVPQFAHLPMVRGPDGERLSKRHGATSVAECRRKGYPPEALINALALLGWSPGHDRTVLSLEDLLAEFTLERVSRSPAIFDSGKLDWISGQHIQRMDGARIAAQSCDRLVESGLLPGDAAERGADWLDALVGMLRGSVERFEQVPERCEGLFAPGGLPDEEDARAVLEHPSARAVLESFGRHVLDDPPADRAGWRAIVDRVRAETAERGKPLFLPIRVAMTGRTSGPELDHLVPLAVQGGRLFPGRIASPADRVRRTLEAVG
jgi:glutamyl-tRNA synthetase